MLNRLLGMIYILMNRQNVTAAELAERFEVSVRTVYRDVETLSMAGIPVYTRKGKNGGISLTEQFVLDKMLVTKKEQTQILSALESLKETGAFKEEETLLKLGEFFKTKPLNWVSIDFSDWSGRRGELYEQIRESILSHKVLVFDYYGQYGGMSSRETEPIQLLFKEYTWYLRAFCRTRQEMRLFKVLRMKRLRILEAIFPVREDLSREKAFQERPLKEEESAPAPDITARCLEGGEKECPGLHPFEAGMEDIMLWIDKKEAYRVYDRFEEEEIEVLPDGSFQVHMKCCPDDWVYGLILSFGPSARVLGTEMIREEIKERIAAMKKMYETDASAQT